MFGDAENVPTFVGCVNTALAVLGPVEKKATSRPAPFQFETVA
jgi:hypothetical protein